MSFKFKSDRARNAFKYMPNEEIATAIELDDKFAAEDASKQAMTAAQSQIDEQKKAREMMEMLGNLDFSKADLGYKKFDIQTPEGQMGGKGKLFPDQERRLRVETDEQFEKAPMIGSMEESDVPKWKSKYEDAANRPIEDILSSNLSQYSDREDVQGFVKAQTGASESRRRQDAIKAVTETQAEFDGLAEGKKPNVGKVLARLGQFADVPFVKEYINQVVDYYDGGNGGTVASLRQQFNTPEKRANVQSIIDNIKGNEKPLASKEQIQIWESGLQTDPVDTENDIRRYLNGINAPVQTFDKLFQPKVNLAEEEARARTRTQIVTEDQTNKDLGRTGIDPATGKPYDQSQKSSAGFALRMEGDIDKIDKLATEGLNEGAIDDAILSNTDQNGLISLAAVNKIRDPKQRQYANAKLDFIFSVLRKESGAAISVGEYRNTAQQYFGAPGDDPATLSQKRELRLQRLAAERTSAGGATDIAKKEYKNLQTEKPTPYAGGQKGLLPPDKAKRKAELLAKKAAGTLGR